MALFARKYEERLVLMGNLLNRMDYNETQKTWRLTGNITEAEYESLQEAQRCLREKTGEVSIDEEIKKQRG